MIPFSRLGTALAAPLTPADVPSTLHQTIKLGPVVQGQYRNLLTTPGETYQVREDITLQTPSPERTKHRRSLAYLGHFSDIHIIDAMSPGRLEPLIALTNSFIDASRPHDTLTTQVLAQMVQTVDNLRFSPITGAPMTAVVNTGDNADSRNSVELNWYIDLMDGKSLTPDSGKAGTYEGVQVWQEATYIWQPADPNIDYYGPYGFPTLPDLLDKAVSMNVTSPGVPAPWYTTFGNHDTLFMGNIRVDPSLQSWAMGDKKAALWPAATRNMLAWMATDTSAFNELSNQLLNLSPWQEGVHVVTANRERMLFDQLDFMQAHLNSPASPGPVGHGFTQSNIDSGKTYWSADITPYLRIFGLDTCNAVTGADGAVPADQYDWLQAELQKCQQENILAIIMSHHNSYTLENGAQDAIGPKQTLYHAEQFIQMLLGYPNMIAWINGHTHTNTINAHSTSDGSSGFWEITTASCVDYPQQQQLIEILDNRDGTLSLFTTALDHDSDAVWTENDYSQRGLASLSRQLAANSWLFEPLVKTGSEFDRNTELMLKAPFDLTKISDATVEKLQANRKAEILAKDGGQR